MTMTPLDLVASAKKNIKEIQAQDALQLIGQELVLDVREPQEYAAGRLPGAINIPRGVLEFQIGNHPQLGTAQNKPILVYCLSGGRSALAVEALQKLGFNGAVSLAGGFKSWVDAGHPTE